MNRKRILALIAALITIGVTKAQDTIDIWNLPPLSIEQGRYTTDWDNLSRQYNDAIRTIFIRGGGLHETAHQVLALAGSGTLMGCWAVQSYKKNS